MDSNTDRGDFTQKFDQMGLSSIAKNSLQSGDHVMNGEIQNYKKSKLAHFQSLRSGDSGNLVILKDRYLLSTDGFGSNNSDYTCLDVDTDESYLCKIITEPYNKVLNAYYQCSQVANPNATLNDTAKIRSIKDIIPASQDRTYLLLEPEHFGNLHTHIRDHRRLPEREAKSMFRQICETVKICHRNGIVLRDLKLRKFYFSDRDRTTLQYESLEGSVILDNPGDDRLTEKIGCPLYVAPELITTTSNFGGKAADIWALGVILYTMLIGKYPFTDLDGQNLFTKILNCKIYIPPGISSKARCLLRSLLRRQPLERLSADDIFYHPWFEDDSANDYEPGSLESTEDQCVPEWNIEMESSMELT